MDVDPLQFLASRLRHDLRGPLLSIRMGLELLEVKEEQAPLLNSMVEQVEGAEKLVGALVDLAAVQSPRKERYRGAPVLRQVVMDRHLEDFEDVEFELEGDRDQLIMILGRLVENARLAGAERVGLKVALQPKQVSIAVHDDGPGFDDVEKALRMGCSTWGRPGLGLAIVESAAAALDGKLKLDSSPLGGASATLLLPRCE